MYMHALVRLSTVVLRTTLHCSVLSTTLNYSVPSMTLNSIRPEQDVIKAPGTSVRLAVLRHALRSCAVYHFVRIWKNRTYDETYLVPVFLLFPSLPSRCVRMGAGGERGPTLASTLALPL